MLLIACPYCGEREESEYRCAGQAHIARPAAPGSLSDDDWAAYLYTRNNPKGLQLERWHHVHGCRQWFNVARHTVSHEIVAVYPMGEAAPQGLTQELAEGLE